MMAYHLQQILALLLGIVSGGPVGWMLRRERERNHWFQ